MNKRRAFLLLAALALGLLLCACGGRDAPSDDGSPWPAAHDGLFVSEYGSLAFPGDGETVTLNFGPELAAATGLPEGECVGSYAFLYQHGLWRYDRADRLELTAAGVNYSFTHLFSETTAERIVLISPLEGQTELIFEKEAAK